MTAAAIHPSANAGWAPHRKMGECIRPNHENREAARHQRAGASKIAVDDFGDQRGHDQHKEKKSAAEPLNDDQ